MLLLQQIVNGLAIGGLYALFAAGLTLTLGVLRILNLAQGVTLTIAAIMGVELATKVSIPFPLLLLSGAVVGAVVGVLLEMLAFRWLRARHGQRSETSQWSTMVGSLAMLLILEALAQYFTLNVVNEQVLSYPTSTFQSHLINLGPDISISTISIVMFVMAVVLTLTTWAVIRFTQVGRASRAVAADPEAAEMLGVNANAYALGVVMASSAMAGVAGILVGVAFNSVAFTTGDSYLLGGFAVVILGGIGSIVGSLVGGLILGVAEGLTVYFIGSNWIDVVTFGLLIVVLLVRPSGLFGRLEVDRA
jgi:branched-chain amino acid transport system permease protein